jgi:multimeric flavodoxin WrbA
VPTILGISASSRVWGNCEASTKLALTEARQLGARCDFVRLTDLRIDACRGCFSCLSDAKACAIGDDLTDLLERVREAGALILASPVYFGLPPAALVALLDRLLVTTAGEDVGTRARPAVTITIMGNAKWRGLAEPVVNLTASLLGFEIAESLQVVAEGPGEALMDGAAVAQLKAAGRRVAAMLAGSPAASAPASPDASKPNLCPTCRSDFFRIEGESIACPVCGERGELGAYLEARGLVGGGGERRWGTPWLRSHVASWIKPSVTRYRAKRKEALRNLAELKRLYAESEKEG